MREEWTNPSNRTKSTTQKMKPTSPIKIWTQLARWFLIVKISRTIIRPLAATISKFSTNTSKGLFRANLELHRTWMDKNLRNSLGKTTINCQPSGSIICPHCKITTIRSETLQVLWTILWHLKEFKEDMGSMTVDWGLLIKMLVDFKAEIGVKIRWKIDLLVWELTVKATGKGVQRDPHSCS